MKNILPSILATSAPLLIACYDTPDSNEVIDQCSDSQSPGDCTGGGTREYAVMTCDYNPNGVVEYCLEGEQTGGYTFDCEFNESTLQCVESNVQYFNVSQVIWVYGACVGEC